MISRMSRSVFVIFMTMPAVNGSNSFLKAHAADSEARISAQEVQISLLEEIETSLGGGTAARKLDELEAQLLPMYNALPKKVQGGLSHAVVRYALHRLFVRRHGWSVKGFDPAGGSFNSSSPAGILKDQVPAFIQDLFEKRLHGKGMGLHELAIFAATIEHLIHNEAVGRLGQAMNVLEIMPTSTMSEAEADEVLDTYMMAYILGENLANMTREIAKESRADMPDLYLSWNETQTFMRSTRADIAAGTHSYEINFAILTKVAEAAGERFGSFQDQDCRDLKNKLVAMEDRGSGRVRLADFYKPALGGAWQFQESVSYLEQLGALDKSDPKNPRVIIPNYLMSQSNCIASSTFYSVCCMDECEALMGHLEAEIAGPEAPADRIAALIAKLPSSSQYAPRALPSTLLQRLKDIAAGHGGAVPIHGRLFAQWMHHAYPRECEYPHLAGTTNPQTEAEWNNQGRDPTASKAEMLEYCSPTQMETEPDSDEVQMPWLHEEELLIMQTPPLIQLPSSLMSIRNVMLLAALGTVFSGLVHTLKKAQLFKDSDFSHKQFV